MSPLQNLAEKIDKLKKSACCLESRAIQLGAATSSPSFRTTEDDNKRVTEDGKFRILEN